MTTRNPEDQAPDAENPPSSVGDDDRPADPSADDEARTASPVRTSAEDEESGDADPSTDDDDGGDSASGPARSKRKGRLRSYLPVSFRPAGREHRIPVDPRRFDFTRGELVVVETDRGLSIARVLSAAGEHEDPKFSRNVRKIVRPAREPDLIAHAEGKAREPELLRQAQEIALHSRLDLRVISVDHQAIGNKLTVFFTSERRVDFRNLVKELSQQLGARIEMRQVGVRDEAKQLGGIAHCGRELCCCTHLRDFCAVSIRMAKDQNLALSPNKISGLCGRLMCCLEYEHSGYAEARKGLPKAGKRVMTRVGPGRVLSLDVLQRRFLHLGDDGIRRTLGPDDLERDEEGRPVRPPPPGESPPPRRAPRPREDTRPPRAEEERPRPPARPPRARGPRADSGGKGAPEDGEAQPPPRPRRSRRGRGRKRSAGPRKDPTDAG